MQVPGQSLAKPQSHDNDFTQHTTTVTTDYDDDDDDDDDDQTLKAGF